MPPVWVYEDPDSVLVIVDAVTRPTRVAKLISGHAIRVEVFGKLRRSRDRNPRLGDRI